MTAAPPLPQWEGRSLTAWRTAWQVPELRILESTTSTNDVLRELALAGAAAGTVVIAEHQTAGRGRLGRTWQAPPGRALLCSVLLRPASADAAAGAALPLRIGLAVAAALEQAAPVRATLKWPNDLLIDGAKVAGILCEAAAGFVVAGIGVNVAQRLSELPHDTDPPATSLRHACGLEIGRADVATALIAALRPLFAAPHGALDQAELARYAARDALRGRAVSVDGEPAGTVRGLDPRGALVVERDGTLRLVHAGTVRSCS